MSSDARVCVCKFSLNWILRHDKFSRLIQNSDEKNPFIIGIGSGSTIVPFVTQLSDFLRNKATNMDPVFVCIPTSEQARYLLLDTLKKDDKDLKKSLKLGTLDEYEKISVTIDGADAVYLEDKFIIKGGGGAHCQEKIVAEASEFSIIVVADENKIEKNKTEISVPVEVFSLAVLAVSRSLKKEFGSDLLSFDVRQCPPGCGKIGPIVTDNGNLILDLKFTEKLYNKPDELDRRIRQYAGIIETGIFWRNLSNCVVVIAGKDGQVKHKYFDK